MFFVISLPCIISEWLLIIMVGFGMCLGNHPQLSFENKTKCLYKPCLIIWTGHFVNSNSIIMSMIQLGKIKILHVLGKLTHSPAANSWPLKLSVLVSVEVRSCFFLLVNAKHISIAYHSTTRVNLWSWPTAWCNPHTTCYLIISACFSCCWLLPAHSINSNNLQCCQRFVTFLFRGRKIVIFVRC